MKGEGAEVLIPVWAANMTDTIPIVTRQRAFHEQETLANICSTGQQNDTTNPGSDDRSFFDVQISREGTT